MNKMVTTHRNITIDTAKGYGIILVIAGHLFTYGSEPFRFIFSFHMPLFFFLSGFLFTFEKYNNSRNLFNKVFRTMVTTYIFFTLLGSFFYLISNRFSLNSHLFYSLFLKGQPDVCGSLWFITCLALVYMLFFFIMRKNSNKLNKSSWVILAICLLIEYLFTKVNTYYFPWKIESVPIALFFFTIGYYYRMNQFVDKVKVKWSILVLALILLISHVNSTVNICVPTLGNPIYFLVASLGGIYFILSISKYKSHSFIRFLGKNSLIIFLMDEFIRYYYLEIIGFFNNKSYIPMTNVPIIYCIVGTLVVTLGCAGSVYLISPLYTKFANILTSQLGITTKK